MKKLVLGIGNLLLADEGVGVHVAQQLLTEEEMCDVDVYDVGTAVFDVLPVMAEAEQVVVVDAMKGGQPPGTIYRLSIEDCEHAGPLGSVHGFDMKSVLHLVDREDLPEVTVIGVEPGVVDWSTDLSGAVADALPEVVTAVKKEISS
jgi:hydrogenase maturation protease